MEAKTTSVNVYIDDIIGFVQQLPDCITRIFNADPLIIDALFRQN